MISIKNLHFSYKQKEILKIKNLELDTSKISVLMGANGSGKSTLLRVLKFLEGDFSTNISYFGKNKLTKEEKRLIYILLPEPSLLNRSIEKNFHFVLKTYGVEKKEWKKRIDELLTMLDLDEKLLSKQPSELSSGQIQKLAFAMALSVRARYYLLDEPSAFLDKNSALLFRRAILKMQKEFKSGFLIVSHDKTFLDSLAQVKFYLHDGMILEFENTNIFDLEKGGVEFSNFIDFKDENSKKIAINPYKIKVGENFKFCIKQAKIIAIRTKKDFVYIRVISGEKILEFVLLDDEFTRLKPQIHQELCLSFDEEAIYFLH